ncbi:hypothetical protein FDECE_2284 [Fusarium decemcellulare]|nr:hypothetical protein FDECE_2284 [Fusarium decemcellulare]
MSSTFFFMPKVHSESLFTDWQACSGPRLSSKGSYGVFYSGLYASRYKRTHTRAITSKLHSDLRLLGAVFLSLNSAEAYDGILEALRYYGLATDSVDSAGSLGVAMSSRIHAFAGALSHPTLGLSDSEIRSVDAAVQATFHFASDVSLFGNVERVRDGNLGAVKFLLGLAQGLWHSGKRLDVPPKVFHYLSSWGVPHLQMWHDTEVVRASSGDTERGTATKGTSVPVRWACEALINAAAEQPGGLERATIFRGSMCATGSATRGLPRDDINRRIIEAALETGMVPDFGSSSGGGMSWITADYLAAAIVHLALRPDEGKATDQGQDIGGEHQDSGAGAKVWHLVQGRGGHHTYADMVALLGTGYDGQRLRLVRPEECFAALRATGSAGMAMHEAALEEWCAAGWVPFELDSTRTSEVLEREAGTKPPTIDRELLLSRVIGERGF